MFVTELQLEEFRSIARANIEFLHPDRLDAERLELPNINLLTGTNGGGKSTVLLAASAALISQDDEAIEQWGDALRTWPRFNTEQPCRITMGIVEHQRNSPNDLDAYTVNPIGTSSRWTLEIPRHEPSNPTLVEQVRFHSTTRVPAAGAPGFVAGYGPGRRVEQPTPPINRLGEYRRVEAVASLFNASAGLIPLESWLIDMEPADTDEVVRLVAALMPSDINFAGRRSGGSYEFRQRGVAVPRTALSDGVQSYVAWTSDLIYRLYCFAGGAPLNQVPGVVLVDEVDQRIHPQWQASMLARVSAVLPRLQFICTAHSPLLAGGLRPENLMVLEPDPDADGSGAMTPSRLREDVYGLNADQVLRSSYFSLGSSRAAGFQSELSDLARRARDGDREASLRFMRRLAGTSPSPESDTPSNATTPTRRLGRRPNPDEDER